MTASEPAEQPPCRRCTINPSVTTVRNEPLCPGCLASFVSSKAIKRMEPFRTRYASADGQRMLVAPVSFGCSSLSLLHILSQFLDVQLQRTYRTGFALHVLHVDDSEVTGVPSCAPQMQQLRQMFPQHQYSTVPLHSLFLDDAITSSPENGIDSASHASARLGALLNALPSATAKSDVASILLSRAIVKFAKAHDCEGIVWGHSTTSLAEKVLSEAAKGRGFSVPWQVTDGPTPHGTAFHFPLRDVFAGELSAYVSHAGAALSRLAGAGAAPRPSAQGPASMKKNNSIDALALRFFAAAEASHPGVASNVVRTSGKLQHSAVGMRRCGLCRMPVTLGQLGVGGWAGAQSDDGAGVGRAEAKLCYGCARSVPEEAVDLLP